VALSGTALTWYQGRWHEGNAPIIGAADHAAWLGSQVFDGARQFEGVRPDIDRHAARIVASAEGLGLIPPVDAETVLALMEEGCRRFDPALALYVRPMMWAKEGTPGIIDIDPASTGFAICIEPLPMPQPGGYALTVSPFRRPEPDMALTHVKAGSLYANNGRIMAEARRRGFHNALSLDARGHVAETASTNVFLVRDGVVRTPVPNGTFLNGLNRQRVIGLLRADGVTVEETSLTVDDFRQADEIFMTGNIAKVMPVARLDDRHFQPGPVAARARTLYWEFAHAR